MSKATARLPDCAPKGMRDQVRRAVESNWGTGAALFLLGRRLRYRVRYRVPGLRADGTVVGEQPVGHAVRRAGVLSALAVVWTLQLLVVLVWFAIQLVIDVLFDGNDMSGSWLARSKLEVDAADPQASAVAVARAIRGGGRFWWAWTPTGTPSRTALVRAADGHVAPVWVPGGNEHAALSADTKAMRFGDGSSIRFGPPPGETARYRRAKGA